jgi:hypothetical protein
MRGYFYETGDSLVPKIWREGTIPTAANVAREGEKGREDGRWLNGGPTRILIFPYFIVSSFLSQNHL